MEQISSRNGQLDSFGIMITGTYLGSIQEEGSESKPPPKTRDTSSTPIYCQFCVDSEEPPRLEVYCQFCVDSEEPPRLEDKKPQDEQAVFAATTPDSTIAGRGSLYCGVCADTPNATLSAPPIIYTATSFSCKGQKNWQELASSVLEPVQGVARVQYNSPQKLLTVTHQASLVTAQKLLQLLNQNTFGARIQSSVPAPVPTTKGAPRKSVAFSPEDTFIHQKEEQLVPASSDGYTRKPIVGDEFVESIFVSDDICSESGCSLIRSSLEPIRAISRIQFQLPSKQLIVKHSPLHISAQEIMILLSHDGFDCSVETDGGSSHSSGGEEQCDPLATILLVESEFRCPDICCQVEFDIVETLLWNSIKGVKRVGFNLATKQITVDHVPALVSANGILRVLMEGGFEAHIEKDGDKTNITASPIIRTVLICGGICCEADCWAIRQRIGTVEGVKRVHFNVPAKRVILFHSPSRVSAKDIVILLNEDKFDATIMDPSTDSPVTTNLSEDPMHSTMIRRSTFKCQGVCCEAEKVLVEALLGRMDGVRNITLNGETKNVVVEHVPSIISEQAMLRLLNEDGFQATLRTRPSLGSQKESSRRISQRRSSARSSRLLTMDDIKLIESKLSESETEVRSILHVARICCPAEIPAIKSIVEPMQGVSKVWVIVTSKLVYVQHEPSRVSAETIRNTLNGQSFGAKIKVDGAKAAATAASNKTMFCTSRFVIKSWEVSDYEFEGAINSDFDETQVQSIAVDRITGTLAVVHNPCTASAHLIKQTLCQNPRTSAELIVDGENSLHIDYEALAALKEDETKSEQDDHRFPRPTVILAVLLWIVSMLSLIGEDWEFLKYVGLGSVAFGIPPIAIKAYHQLRRLRFDANSLMFLASLGALALGEFTEAAAVVSLFALSEWLEVRATTRARQALSAIVDLKPEKANLVHHKTKEVLQVPASAVPLGALVVVKTGDKIPCDGVVVEGHSSLDESSLTGESRPISKGVGEAVSGGTVNSGVAQLMVRTTALAENSAVARLIRLVEEAQAHRSQTEKIVDEFASIYTPLVIIAAVIMCSIPWAFGSDTGRHWTENGLVLIVVACPCALIISTPVAYVAGLAATAQKGVLIKGGAFLEGLGRVKQVCLDKTGTITNGEFALLHLEVASLECSREEILQYLALMEERSSHPVANAIMVRARNENAFIPPSMVLESHVLLAGEGVMGVISGKEVYVGNERLFDRIDLLKDLSVEMRNTVESWKQLGGTIGFMSIEGYGIVCAFCASDGVRDESPKVIHNFKQRGIAVTMLTGDNASAAVTVGRMVGLAPSEIKSKLLPDEKLEYLQSIMSERKSSNTRLITQVIRNRGTVLFCGDGVNDAPALAAADVGVAMGEGAALAMETADVTLLDSNLEKLEYSLQMGRRVIRKIHENIAFSVVTKGIVLGFAVAGKTHLWAAIATDVGAMILVTLNAMMLLGRQEQRTSIPLPHPVPATIEKVEDDDRSGMMLVYAGCDKKPTSGITLDSKKDLTS